MSNQALYWVLLACAAFYVLWRGGTPERLAISGCAGGSILSAGTVWVGLGTYERLQFGILFVDLGLLAFFLWLALRADRYWPLWVSGFHSVGVMTHFAKALAPDLNPWAYAVGQAAGSYLIIAAIVAGTVRHRLRLARDGADNSWSRSSARSRPRTRPPGRNG